MKKNFVKGLSILAVLSMVGFLVVGAAVASECRSLVDNKCSSCHFSNEICPKLNKGKGSWTWKRTVKSMIDKGTVLTEQEEEKIVECLSHPDQDVRKICAD